MISLRNDTWKRARTLLYVVAFAGLFLLDARTPIGVADWIMYVILVSIAAIWGGKRELRVILVIASALIVAGLFTSPVTIAPFWIGVLNRSFALLVLWATARMADRRRSAEEAERKAVADLKILQGLLPMCAECKSIRDEHGEWHRLETFLSARSEVQLSHGLCPPCAAKFMDELESSARAGGTDS